MTDNKARDESKQYATHESNASTSKAYKTKEIGEIIGAATSTIRKYSIALEDEGYNFIRNPQKQRLFIDDDILSFRKMLELTRAGTLVNNAAKIVANENKERLPAVNKQDEAIAKLLEYVAKQDKTIEDQSLELKAVNNKLDRVLSLLESSDDMALDSENDNNKEVQREYREDYKEDQQAEIYKEDNKKKRSFLSRLFK